MYQIVFSNIYWLKYSLRQATKVFENLSIIDRATRKPFWYILYVGISRPTTYHVFGANDICASLALYQKFLNYTLKSYILLRYLIS